MLVTVLIFTFIILSVASGIFVLMHHSEEKEAERIISFAMQRYQSRARTDSVPDSIPDDSKPVFPHQPVEQNTPEPDDFFSSARNSPNSMFRNWISIDIDGDGSIAKIFRSMNRDNDAADAQEGAAEISDSEISETALQIYSTAADSGSVSLGGITYRYRISRADVAQNSARIILLDRSVETATLQRLGAIIGMIAIAGIAAVFLLSIFLSRWAVKPIEEAWRQQKEFIANASHELKTPLTVISANTDVIMSNPDETVSSQSKWFKYIKDETEKMSGLVGSMLYLAKEDRDDEKLIMSEFDGSETIEGACLVFEALAFEKGKTLETDIEPDVKCSGDKERIAQLAHILIDNAVSHSAANGYIKVSFHRYKGKARLTVENNGEQIKPEDIPRIFERFYRTDKSRTGDTGGFGLGLSIAKMIADKHNGTLTVTSSDDGITKFTAIW